MTKVSITIEHNNQRRVFTVEQKSRFVSPVLFAAVKAVIATLGDEIALLTKAFQVISDALNSVSSDHVKETDDTEVEINFTPDPSLAQTVTQP